MIRHRYRCQKCALVVPAPIRPMCCGEMMALVGRGDPDTQRIPTQRRWCTRCGYNELLPGDTCSYCTTTMTDEMYAVATPVNQNASSDDVKAFAEAMELEKLRTGIW